MEALGVDRRTRAAWADEATDVIRRLFSEENVTHHGRFFHLSDITLTPRPVQNPPDIWFGGDSPAALRRVGRRGDGWLPSFIPASVYGACRRTIEAEAAASGREVEADHYGALIGYLGVGASDGEISVRLRRILETRRPGLDPREVIPSGAPAIRALLEAYIDAGASKFVLVPVSATGPAAEELGMLREEVLVPLGAA
jgi:alkanesulfonate monooxygenase SsuD/methylene tetrahydromethanopterin reductase-like flavin-dependent oxidoreductase (luciferase family)